MNLVGAFKQIENFLHKHQSSQVAKIVQNDNVIKQDPTKYAKYKTNIVVLDFMLSTTLTVSTLFKVGKFTVSVPAWIVGQPLAFLIGCVSQKTFRSLNSQLPTLVSIKETAQKAYRAGLGALISFIAGLGASVGLNTTPWNITHQHNLKNVGNRHSIEAYVQDIEEEKQREKQSTGNKPKLVFVDPADYDNYVRGQESQS